jgi:UDP-glucuronate 4-epimerase
LIESGVKPAALHRSLTDMANVLVTGAAGFIGFHTCQRLLARGDDVVGWDNLNNYYSVQLKQDRLAQLTGHPRFQFEKLEIADRPAVERGFAQGKFDLVLHLAAQAGVRYSLENPQAYIDANLVGFGNMLEGCRHHQVRHLVYASSSSVYGANTRMPFSVHDNVDHPVSLYAATKKANELLAHSYSHLYHIPTTGLRFFTVYGPWGRPDMALFKFTESILAGKPIDVFNHGRMKRDFTYIDDIVEGVLRTADRLPTPDPHWSGDAPDPSTSTAPYRVYNIGNHQPVELSEFIEVLERALGVTAKRNYLPMQPGDVLATFADIEDLSRDVGFHPKTSIEDGIARFVAWYRDYFQRGGTNRNVSSTSKPNAV